MAFHVADRGIDGATSSRGASNAAACKRRALPAHVRRAMKLRPRPLSLQSGMAVITAMLLVALAASAATFLLWRQQLWLGQVESIAARAQTDALARAAIEWRRRGGAGQITAPFAEADAIETAVSDPQGLFNL